MQKIDPARAMFDAEIHLPASIDRQFLAVVLVAAAEKKVDFGLFHEEGKIIIAHYGGDEDHLPSLWSDGCWHFGREPEDLDEIDER
ncbi:hypothetical protein [Ensifer aridi]|uniref:hypothetical protein n=1 Tax=Ensifer aridi TaxID=1708715 RepID=UPI001FCD6EE4|nr:hypothetical protein [Ensifer aridi]